MVLAYDLSFLILLMEINMEWMIMEMVRTEIQKDERKLCVGSCDCKENGDGKQ